MKRNIVVVGSTKKGKSDLAKVDAYATMELSNEDCSREASKCDNLSLFMLDAQRMLRARRANRRCD